VQLQRIVPDDQGGGAQPPHLAGVLQAQAQRAMRAQQRHHPRPHRDQAAPAKLLLIGFALFEQLRV
jgi:hypothetical protein